MFNVKLHSTDGLDVRTRVCLFKASRQPKQLRRQQRGDRIMFGAIIVNIKIIGRFKIYNVDRRNTLN